MAALLTIEAANTDKLAMYLGECRELGVPILPPDINSSELAFTVVAGGRPLRALRRQERRRGRGPVDPRRPPGARADRFALHAVRARRPAAREQARAREPGQGRRARFARADDIESIAAAPRAALRGGRPGARARQPASARSREGAEPALRRVRRRRGTGRRRSRCRTPARGPRRSSSPARRKRSAST